MKTTFKIIAIVAATFFTLDSMAQKTAQFEYLKTERNTFQEDVRLETNLKMRNAVYTASSLVVAVEGEYGAVNIIACIAVVDNVITLMKRRENAQLKY